MVFRQESVTDGQSVPVYTQVVDLNLSISFSSMMKSITAIGSLFHHY